MKYFNPQRYKYIVSNKKHEVTKSSFGQDFHGFIQSSLKDAKGTIMTRACVCAPPRDGYSTPGGYIQSVASVRVRGVGNNNEIATRTLR